MSTFCCDFQNRTARLALTSWLLLAILASGSGVAQEGKSAVAQGSKGAVAQLPAVPVLSSCSGGGQSCTATAVCPKGMRITSGWSFYIVPDDRSAAYGICGTASAACVLGTTSCTVTTAVSGCGAPGWNTQSGLVAIACQ